MRRTLAAALVFGAAVAGAEERPVSFDQPRFSESEYVAHLKFLGGDICEGRAPGTRGGDLAAAYIAAQFEAVGLRPMSEADGFELRGDVGRRQISSPGPGSPALADVSP